MDETRRLFAFNRWATLRFMDVLDGIADEELGRKLGSSFPSLLDTLVHLVSAEWVWLRRWQGTSPASFPAAGTLASVAAVRAFCQQLWADQDDFLAALGEGALETTVAFKTFDGSSYALPLGDQMRHVVNHATYHRGQLATMLRQLGRTPPSTDLLRFYREQQAGQS